MPGGEATREWSVLLAACSIPSGDEKVARLRSLLQDPIRWQRLLEFADDHGVRPLLHQALASVADLIPPDALRVLEQARQTNLHKSLLLARELIRIVDRLASRGIEVIPYKGLALAELLYGDIALRQTGDIDLLIHTLDLPRTREALRELQYSPHIVFSPAEERAYLKSGYEAAFDGPAGPNLVEVQWAIVPRFYSVPFVMKELFARAVTLPVAGQPVKTLALEDLFLVLSVHAAKHAWGRLMWLCDLARLMSVSGLNWVRVGAQGRSLGVARILRVTMILANDLLDVPIPSAALASLPDDSAATVLAQQVRARIISGAPCDVESLAYFRLMIQLREHPADRVRFLTRLALTPGPGEWKVVRLPGVLFPLYRLVRLTRLASRMVRA